MSRHTLSDIDHSQDNAEQFDALYDELDSMDDIPLDTDLYEELDEADWLDWLSDLPIDPTIRK